MCALKSAFSGCITGIPDISVDNFNDKTKKAYFLSHFHTDHYVGLVCKENATLLRQNKANIYMSKKTAAIFRHTYRNDYGKLKNQIKTLETDVPHVLEDLEMQVTLIPVVHMPGAVMFLFKTKDQKNILYTGDFVIEKEKLKDLSSLHEDGVPIILHEVYYDATFESKHRELASRRDAIDAVVREIGNWWEKYPSRDVSIYIRYNYGYEELFQGIYEGLERKEQLFFYNNYYNDRIFSYFRNIVNEKDAFTLEPARSRITIYNKNKIEKTLYDDLKKNGNSLHIDVYVRDKGPVIHDKENSIVLVFPTHCSGNQLQDFKKYFGHHFTTWKPFGQRLKD